MTTVGTDIGYGPAMMEPFEELVPRFRRELLAHCYRMTGSLSDAEDALQNAMVRAWRAFASFEGRSSVRTWLYKITTNACLDLLGSRRIRTMPELVEPGTDDAVDPAWLEPYPQPDAALASREAVRLAFVLALQVLPPRQRATLILRDVVGLSAEETATTLDTTVAAVNSALQRARAVLETQPRARKTPITGAVGELLGKYMRLWESGDAAGLVALLRNDAVLSMPPLPMWASGPQAIAELLSTVVFTRAPFKLVACTANGAPAFGVYTAGKFGALTVLDIEGDQIVSMQSFLDVDPVKYGLSPTLSAGAVELVPGAQLGRYHLEHVLGAGGMGRVWLAHDRSLDRQVALKVLLDDAANDGTSRARLLREARAMARLRHPNVITVYDADTIDGHDVVAMELVDGTNLTRWAATAHPLEELRDVLVAAGRGLAAAHAAGLVHRDFKPDNVLVGHDGRVLVADFGLARTQDSLSAPITEPATPSTEQATVADAPGARRDDTTTREVLEHAPTRPSPAGDPAALDSPLTDDGIVMGTPAYMAPEQFRAIADAKSDQFAFCVAAWELLAAGRPFTRGHLQQMARGEDVEVRYGDRIPPGLRPALVRGLERDPDRRWPSMDALLDELTDAATAK